MRFERIPSATPLLITFFTNNAVAHREINVGVGFEGPVPLAAASDNFSITNQGAANVNWITVIFNVTP
jgi:hypothetical protein